MKERLIINGYEIAGRMPIFKPEMRQAIRDDRKTQTRRIIKPQPPGGGWVSGCDIVKQFEKPIWNWWDGSRGWQYDPINKHEARCPYGKVGDIRVMPEPLFCNELGWAEYADPCDESLVRTLNERHAVEWRWKRGTLSSMFMPTEYGRTLCRTESMRVERLQDITRTDIRAEGLVCPEQFASDDSEYNYRRWYHDAWVKLWDSINAKKYPWVSNPWVWVPGFERIAE